VALGQCSGAPSSHVLGVLMTLHSCRDFMCGATGSYANFYALGCFLTGVLGFQLVSSGGYSAWLAAPDILPKPMAHGASGSGACVYMVSNTHACLDIPLSELPTVSHDSWTNGVHALPFAAARTPMLFAPSYMLSGNYDPPRFDAWHWYRYVYNSLPDVWNSVYPSSSIDDIIASPPDSWTQNVAQIQAHFDDIDLWTPGMPLECISTHTMTNTFSADEGYVPPFTVPSNGAQYPYPAPNTHWTTSYTTISHKREGTSINEWYISKDDGSNQCVSPYNPVGFLYTTINKWYDNTLKTSEITSNRSTNVTPTIVCSNTPSGTRPPFIPQGAIAPLVVAIKSNTSPLANSGLYVATSYAYSSGCNAVADGVLASVSGSSVITSVTSGTFKIIFDTRCTGSIVPESGMSWTVFPPIDWAVNFQCNFHSSQWHTDPDSALDLAQWQGQDLDRQGPTNNPEAFPGPSYDPNNPGNPWDDDHSLVIVPIVTPSLDSKNRLYSIFEPGVPAPPPGVSWDPSQGWRVGSAPNPGDCGILKAWFTDNSSYFPEVHLWWRNVTDKHGNRVGTLTEVGGGWTVSQRTDNMWNMPDDGTYHTQSGSYMLRAVYQSPHESGWQVRLCLESSYDRRQACLGVGFSVAPGFGATVGSNGDFPVGGQHLHGPLWHNTTDLNYVATVVGIDPVLAWTVYGVDGIDVYLATPGYGNVNPDSAMFGSNIIDSQGNQRGWDVGWRFYAWGDDETGSVVVLNRNIPNIWSGDAMLAFGLPEDETQPLPPLDVQRLFVYGGWFTGGYGNGVMWNDEGNTLQSNGSGLSAGVAFSLDKRFGPISCVLSSYAYVDGSSGGARTSESQQIRYDVQAADTPFLHATELVPVDVVAGTLDSNCPGYIVPFLGTQVYSVLHMEPRRMGIFPFARQGRAANQAQWSAIGPDKTWFHAMNGVYLPWGGTTPLS